MTNMFRWIKRFRKPRQNEQTSLDSEFNSLMSWTGVWAMTAPDVRRFDPIVVADVVVGFLRAVLYHDKNKAFNLSKIPRTPDALSGVKLAMFYQEQWIPSLSEFKKLNLVIDDFMLILEAAAETGSPLYIMNTLVQILFWQAWKCFHSLPSDEKIETAMESCFARFRDRTKRLSAMMQAPSMQHVNL